jgi:hypothetical protein
MVGALIVEGDFADVPEIASARERVLVIGQVVFDVHRTVEDFQTTCPETATRFNMVNGQREPIIRIRPARSSAGGSSTPRTRPRRSVPCHPGAGDGE